MRLNYSINQIYDKIKWDRSLEKFFDIFVDISIKYYERVSKDAQKRITAMRKFREDGYVKFSF